MLVGEGQRWFEGEERAWGILEGMSPDDVSRRAKAVYDRPSGRYRLPMFGEEVVVSPKDRRISGNSPKADFVTNELHYYSRLPVLFYLIQAKDVPLSGKLVNPSHASDVLIFSRGSHVLPLDRMVERYGSDVPGFLTRGMEFGGGQLNYGDASLRLFPFPRVPVVLLLWRKDDEFPARADLLFDSTGTVHLPPDIIWSTAMLTILVML